MKPSILTVRKNHGFDATGPVEAVHRHAVRPDILLLEQRDAGPGSGSSGRRIPDRRGVGAFLQHHGRAW
jgi:hypothetical protein